MATPNAQTTRAAQPTRQTATTAQATNKATESSSQQAGLARQQQDARLAGSLRPNFLGLPLTPFDLLRVTPLFLFRRMADEFDRALLPMLSDDRADAGIAWVPTIEIFETEGRYHILAELPGLSPDDVQVMLEGDSLVLQGEREDERETRNGGVRRGERQFGFFYRRIPLPEGADPNQARAQFHDGVLEIEMPAPNREANRRQIQIEKDSKSSPEQSSAGQSKHAA